MNVIHNNLPYNILHDRQHGIRSMTDEEVRTLFEDTPIGELPPSITDVATEGDIEVILHS